ncbi:hypothetical protein J3R82DRAFT_3583 [Butyriboletus roseoflavus]|nr:hypothetical protein J3R82DRAFT_3583 [Butyriboletus roseoflavus]
MAIPHSGYSATTLDAQARYGAGTRNIHIPRTLSGKPQELQNVIVGLSAFSSRLSSFAICQRYDVCLA